MSDSLYCITESSELNRKNTHLAMQVNHVLEFLRRNTYAQCFNLLRNEILSHTCETRKFVMAILHGKQGLLCETFNI